MNLEGKQVIFWLPKGSLTFGKVMGRRTVVRFRFLVLMILMFLLALREMALSLSVDEAIDYALANNESYLRALNETRKASQKVIEAQAGALPQLSASLIYQRNWELPTYVVPFGDEGPVAVKFGTNNNYVADLTLTQPIYVGGKVFTALSIAKSYRKLTMEQLRQARQELKLQVIKAYYGAVMAEQLLKVATSSEAVARKGLEVVENLFAAGQVSDYEVLRAKVRLANVLPNLIQARANAKLAREALNNLIGLPLDDRSELEFVMDSSLYALPPLDLDSAQAQALQSRPEMKMMAYQTEMLRKAVSIAWGDWRPSIFFTTKLQYQAQFDADRFFRFDDFVRSSYSGIMITVPVFDSWRTVAKAKQAKVDLAQSRLQANELADNIRLEVEQNWWNYQKARENVASQGQVVEMAKRGLEIARLRYENGVGTQLELFDAEAALTAAETNRVMAYYELITGYAALRKALGDEDLTR